MNKLKITIGQYSSKGVKDQNEDSFGVLVPKGNALESKGITAIIADGMGSCEHPKQASENCVHGFLNDYYSTPDSWSVKSSAAKVLTALNSWLFSRGLDSHAKAYVSTFSALILKSTTAHIFHIGDSRIYRLRDGNLEQLSQDHRVWVSKEKSYLSRAIGIDLHLDIDYKSFPLEKGDIFIMTTDGIHDFINNKEIKKILSNNNSILEELSTLIVNRSLEHRSNDNLTCQLIRVDEIPTQQVSEVYDNLTKLPFPPELDVGMQLDNYIIIKEINASARSQLYLVEDIDSKKQMVMKTPSVNYEDDPAYLEQFYLEEWAGKRLNHPNLLTTFDPESKDIKKQKNRTALYFLMEHIQAISLDMWIKKNPQPDIAVVLKILEQIIKGIRSIHRMEMLHRDLKPDNIMINSSGHIKIIDFGSIKIAGVHEVTSPIQKQELLGTKDYTAPEYLLGIAASKQSDLFSIATITYELLTGKLPYGKQLQHSAPISKLKYIPSYSYNPMIPTWFDSALKKALYPDINYRYDTFSEFLADLKKPNELFSAQHMPLIKKNPVLLWQLILTISVFLNGVLIYLLQ